MPPNAGKGRKKGSQNKLTATVKEAFERAFASMQEDDENGERPEHCLEVWGKANPNLFYPLSAKLIPAQVNANVQGSIAIVNEFAD